MNVLARLAVLAFVLVPFSTAISATGAPLPKVPFDGNKYPPNFSNNCRALTTKINTLLGRGSSTCRANQGVVMIKAMSSEYRNEKGTGFMLIAIGTFGWAVNEDYYGEGANLVVRDVTKNGKCLMIAGSVAAFAQGEIKNNGKPMQSTLIRTAAGGQKVECPDFLR